MKVLVADKFEQSGLDGLKQLGVETVYDPDLQGEALHNKLVETGSEVLVVRSTKVPADVMDGAKLQVIIRAGAGYNTIDVESASKMGIRVANCPGKNSNAVAELAFGLILACDRRIPDNVMELRAGKWNKKRFGKGAGVSGRTLGIIGLGNIGQLMVTRAQAFGMRVVAFSRWLTPDVAAQMGIGHARTVEEVAALSDAISVHVALTADTKGLLGEKFFSAMKPGAIFVNTSRAEVVDQAALEKATKDKGIIAGLDVFADEPSGGEGEYSGSLKENPNVYCTHHIGASTNEAQEAIAAETVRIVKEYSKNGVVPNAINVRSGGSASHLLVVRHYDRVGVLAHILGVLKDEGVNVQEMENVLLAGAQSAIAQIAIDREPSEKAVHTMKLNACILDASLIPLHR